MIIKAKFADEPITITDPIYQYNYGQVLQIEGLALPSSIEVHFAVRDSLQALCVVGTTKNKITTVTIPDELLINNHYEMNYRVDAFIYITDENSGYTKYHVVIPVKARPEPVKKQFEQKDADTVDSLVNAMNQAVTEAKACKLTPEEKSWMLTLFQAVSASGDETVQSAYTSLKEKWGEA